MTTQRTERRLLAIDATTLDDDDLDVWIGAAKSRIKALTGSDADVDALKERRRLQRKALRDKLKELTDEAKSRGLRN